MWILQVDCASGKQHFVKTPLMFGPAIVAGRLYDLSGGYASTCVVVVTGMLLAAPVTIALAVDCHRRNAALTAPAGIPNITLETQEAG